MLKRIERALLSKSYMAFVRDAWQHLEPDEYIHGRHIEVMVSHLEAAARKQIDRLLINIPPNCSKSSVIMDMFPAWVWTWDRSASFLCQTYSQDLTLKSAANCRRLIETDWYQERWPEVQFLADDNAKKYYRVQGGGWRLSTVVGGRTTGEHPNFVLIDDPIKVDDAENRDLCEKWKTWYTGTVSTRGMSKQSVHVLAQQRVSVFDPSSVAIDQNQRAVLEGEPEPWHHVCLPMRYESAIAMKDRGYGGDWRSEEGELLFPRLIPESSVKKAERALGPRKSRAQMQQAPEAADGQFLPIEKLIRIKPEQVPKCDLWVRFWDKAATEGAGCRTAGVRLGIRKLSDETYNYIITHVHKGQWSTDNVEIEIHRTAVGDVAVLSKEKYVVGLEREPGSGGVFSVNATKRRLRDFVVREIPATKDKLVTAEPLAVAMGFGEVFCVEAPWTDDLIAELSDAPYGKYMDQFDALAKAVILANEEIGKRRKRAIIAGLGDVTICKTEGCKRPAAPDSVYCCPQCEIVDAFEDETLACDHAGECNERAYKHRSRRR